MRGLDDFSPPPIFEGDDSNSRSPSLVPIGVDDTHRPAVYFKIPCTRLLAAGNRCVKRVFVVLQLLLMECLTLPGKVGKDKGGGNRQT